ncbi:MAG: LysR family transcriptional regulator [Myxococcota bacterium]
MDTEVALVQIGQMVLFARVVEAGSFAEAARGLGQTRASVSKQIGALEERVGAQLLHRTTRRMHLTEIGSEFYAHCARIAEEVEGAERAVASLQGEVRGRLGVAAPATFGRRYVAPLLADFLALQPEVQVDLALSDVPGELRGEGVDVFIQIESRADTSRSSRLLADSRHVVCAAPAYLESKGTPGRPEDLREHDCLLYSSLPSPARWRFRTGKSVRVHGRFSVNHGESLREAVLEGLGIAYMPVFIVGEDLADGSLVPILEDWAHSVQKVWLSYPRGRYLAPKVRVFVEFMLDRFLPRPPWEQSALG